MAIVRIEIMWKKFKLRYKFLRVFEEECWQFSTDVHFINWVLNGTGEVFSVIRPIEQERPIKRDY